MVQKTEPRRRGRPRAYDPDVALRRAMDAFWKTGYAATSLDDLSEATGMNRPSLYGAFGDKEALYLKALARYREATRAALTTVLDADTTLRECLTTVFGRALDMYQSSGRGCFAISTAATEAMTNPTVRGELQASIRGLDEIFAARIRRARDAGELDDDADPAVLGQLSTSTLHALALRSRAGEPRAALDKTAASMVDLICRRRARRSR